MPTKLSSGEATRQLQSVSDYTNIPKGRLECEGGLGRGLPNRRRYNTQCDQCYEIVVRVQQIQVLLLGTFLHSFSQIFSIQVSNLKMHTPQIQRPDSNLNIRGLNCFIVIFPAGDRRWEQG